MLGAIIGDLAASTYINDHSLFYERLFSDDASLSEKGMLILEAVSILNDNRFAEPDRFHKFVPANATDDWKLLILCVVNSWWYDDVVLCRNRSYFFVSEQIADKSVIYSTDFLSKIIYYLRNGLTKDETYQNIGEIFKECRHEWDWKHQGDLICYVIRAWDAFYNSFDFGSALHNAMRMEGDKHLLGTLTGAIAEAMYGCRYYFKKKKYCREGEYPRVIKLPKSVLDKYGSLLDVISKQKESKRVFFYKNDAMTNVERHNFVPVRCELHYKNFTEEQKRLITKAFWPDWDNRYGIYWDNGWYYVYRSFYLIARFQLIKSGNFYEIRHLQQGEDKDVQSAVDGALSSAINQASW